jgi:S-adenosyl methyltransferase
MEVTTEQGQASPDGHQPRAVTFDATVAHPARIYDYWLGGKDNFAADRRAAEEVLATMPVMVQVARSVRLFLASVVHYLAADLGIRQFLDIGTGPPMTPTRSPPATCKLSLPAATLPSPMPQATSTPTSRQPQPAATTPTPPPRSASDRKPKSPGSSTASTWFPQA